MKVKYLLPSVETAANGRKKEVPHTLITKLMTKYLTRIAIALLFAAFTHVLAQAQKLSAEEQKLVSYIDAHTAEAIALLEKTVNIESPTQNSEGVKKVGLVFKSEFDALGLTTKL